LGHYTKNFETSAQTNSISPLKSLFSHSLFAFPFRQNPGGAHLRSHEGLEIFEKRLHGREDLQCIIGEILRQHSLIAELMDGQELLVAQQLDLGVIRGVPSRRALKFLPGDLDEIFAKFGRLDHLFYRLRIIVDGSTDGLQILRRGHVRAACQKRSAGHDVDVVGQPQRVPAARSEHGREVAFVRGPVLGKAHIVVDAKDGVPGDELAQWLDDIKAEDEALDEVLEERFCLVVLWAVGGKPFVVVVLAKAVQESEDGRELGHGNE
jgi:hypothetical protein